MAAVQASPTPAVSSEVRELQELPGMGEKCPLRLDRTPELGRFLVAARDLSEGEILLREAPLVLGPQAISAPICLGCHRPLGFSKTYLCSRCGSVMLCGPACEESPFHTRECEALRDGMPFSATLLIGDNANWQVVTPLRCFVNQLKGIFQLEAHIDARRSSGAWQECENNVVSVLHNHGLLRNFPDHAIQRVCGILDVNSFEVRGPHDESGRSECLRGVYPNAAFMAHSCIPNTHIAIAKDLQIVVKAATKIPKGETIYHNYSDSLMCTAVRREQLKMGKYFSCKCRRCLDPTELGSHLSSLRCADENCEGAVISEDPLRTLDANWFCDTCGRIVEAHAVHAGMRWVQIQLTSMNRSDPNAMENLLSKLLNSLHPQHAAIMEVTQALSGLYREQIMDMGDAAPVALLKRKLELCESLLPSVEKLEPPLSRLRGITLYEMASPLVAVAQRTRDSYKGKEGMNVTEVKVQLERSETLLREAARLLLNEPPATPEAQLARVALLELRNVLQDLAEVTKAFKKAASKNKGRKNKK